MRRVIDTFTFFNELPMLLFRLTELDEVVDTFVVVEATITHSGLPKPLFFQENKAMFEKFLHKIIHIVVEDLPNLPDTGTWVRENAQRSAIGRAAPQLNLQPDDLIIVSDVDEIPDPTQLAKLKVTGLPGGIHSLHQDFYYYNITCKSHDIWTHPKITEFRAFGGKIPDFNSIRQTHTPLSISPGGWHFSYFGGVDKIRTKLQSFAHDEFNTDYYTNPDRINSVIESGKDLFDRSYVGWFSIPKGLNTYLPKHVHLISSEGV